MKEKTLSCLLGSALLITIISSFIFISCDKKPEPKTETSEYLAISHELEGRDNCLQCHEDGKGDAPVAPAEDHVGFTNDLCLGCHKPAE